MTCHHRLMALEGQRSLAEQSFDVLITDHRMPDRSGMDVIKDVVATTPTASGRRS
ncbi:MAG: hypothetical protein R2708_27755 [Vicinamibacterales bacterium]